MLEPYRKDANIDDSISGGTVSGIISGTSKKNSCSIRNLLCHQVAYWYYGQVIPQIHNQADLDHLVLAMHWQTVRHRVEAVGQSHIALI